MRTENAIFAILNGANIPEQREFNKAAKNQRLKAALTWKQGSSPH